MDQTMNAYRTRSRKMLMEKNMPPPNKPEFDAATDPFFYDVYFESGSLAIREKDEGKLLSAEAKAELDKLKKEVADLKKDAPPEPPMACAVEEGDPVDQKVFIRGDSNSPGEDAPKTFPKVLLATAPQEQPIASGSGRLGLAEWLAKPNHPLTARVMVNRIWEWHFGDGLVRTPDNFGKMGERPTHPELLDYLASRFTSGGWSIKAMHRTIMLSSAYQMASQTAPEADPENRLLSRFNRTPPGYRGDSRRHACHRRHSRSDHGRHSAERFRHRQGKQRRPAESESGKAAPPDGVHPAAPVEPSHAAQPVRFRRCDHRGGQASPH
jgi:hypothetical protein